MKRPSSISSLLLLGFPRRTAKFQINGLRFFSDQSHLSLSRRPGPLTQYRTLVQQEKLRYDPNQEKVAVELDNLLGRLEQYEKAMEEYHVNLAKWEENRESERRRLLIEEAEAKQQSGLWTSLSKQRDKLVRMMSR